MFLITSRNSTFIRGVLIWQLNSFYHKVDTIRLFERKQETNNGTKIKASSYAEFLERNP